jgi:hypothetical protein
MDSIPLGFESLRHVIAEFRLKLVLNPWIEIRAVNNEVTNRVEGKEARRRMKRDRRLQRLVMVCALAAGLTAAGDSMAADDARLLTNLEGRWVFAGDGSERQARLDAIEATVSQMAWVARGIARKRITASTPIHDHYVFTVDTGTLTISEDAFKGFTTPWDGTPVEISKQMGGPAILTREFTDEGLRSHWQQKKGAGTEIYRTAADGRTMIVTVVISSPRLPSDVRYELTYRRAEPVASNVGGR